MSMICCLLPRNIFNLEWLHRFLKVIGKILGDKGRRAVGDQGLLRGPRVGSGHVSDSRRISVARLHRRLQHDTGQTSGMCFPYCTLKFISIKYIHEEMSRK